VKYKRVVIIDPLPDDVFLEIFDICLRDPNMFVTKHPVQRMREWLILAHVCQRWRRIIFASPRRLDLYLSCIRGTPVRQNLDYWPLIFPLDIDYPGPVSCSDPIPGDDDNIVAALTHTDRIHHVKIYASSSLFRKVATVMQESFPVLTRLNLTWDPEDLPSTLPVFLPQGFLSGSAPHLKHFYLSGVSFSRFPTLLLSASNLLTLQLDDILPSILPETIVAGLAMLTRLSTLSIAFDREITQSDQWRSRSNSPIPTILPTLTLFDYKGYSEYLEDLLALIDMPLVYDITIEYFLADIQVSQLSQFIDRTQNFKKVQFERAHVTFYYDRVDVELDLPQEESSVADITLRFRGPWEDIQVPRVVDVLDHLFSMFSNVDHLSTRGNCPEWRDMDDLDSVEWAKVPHPIPCFGNTASIWGRGAIYYFCARRHHRGDAHRSDASAPLAVVRRGQQEGGRRARWIHRAVPLFASALWSPCYGRQHARRV
jgi:hypothetical protein